ncbi:hypothetical protein BH09MYX1_BH09MYX1_03090 [soil metagenome]
MQTAVGIVFAIGVLGFVGLGIVSFYRIAVAAQISPFWPWNTFAIYKYAFTTPSAFPDTRRMLVGFIGAVVQSSGPWRSHFSLVRSLVTFERASPVDAPPSAVRDGA